MYTFSELSEKINKYISQNLYSKEPTALYEPINYILSLGGKRVRPALMLMAYNMYREHVDDIMDNAVALETYHNFTLLHDDLMDRSDLRRGNVTVHKKWNENTAILSGDTMLILAYQLFTSNADKLRTNDINETFFHAQRTFIEATLGVCEGQQYDMDFEQRDDVTEAEYMEMIRLKTSILLAGALKIGAQLANAPERDSELLYNFGEKIGLAYQLQDDVLDVFGDTKLFKKKLGADIVDNKKTFLLIKAFEKADENDKRIMREWMSKDNADENEKIETFKNIYVKYKIKEMTEERVNSLFLEATSSLGDVMVDESKKEALHKFADKLLRRNF